MAVLLSGTGRTLQNLLDVIHRGGLDVEIVAVVSSRAGVLGLDIAKAAEIPHFVVERRHFVSDDAYTLAIDATLRPFDPDLWVLAGFLRKLAISEQWTGRVLNIHPALLPEMSAASGKGFYGDRVHEEVLRRRASESGATVHLVDNNYDTGPVLARATVPVLDDDTVETLSARVFAAECELYPRAINDYVREHRQWLLR